MSPTSTPSSHTFDEPILHVDMDAFFVEVERLRDPSLIGKPVVVGGDGPRGVVASSSYEARSAGVRSAMPMTMAKRLLPGLTVVAPEHGEYQKASEGVFAVFRSVTPMVEGISVDEAFLDVSGLRFHFESSEDVALAVRQRIRDTAGLPASVGIATTKFVAKIASSAAKPDGVEVVSSGSEQAFLDPLSVDHVWGVGQATRASLEQLGVDTIRDLRKVPADSLRQHIGVSLGDRLSTLARGIDPRPVTPDSSAKSISAEETFADDVVDDARLDLEAVRLVDRVAGRVRRSGLMGRTVSVKVRFEDFTTVARSETLSQPTALEHDILPVVRKLIGRARPRRRPVRLLGVAMTALAASSEPIQLQVDSDERWESLGRAVDEARVRFGRQSVGPARLANREEDRTQ